MMTSDDKVGGWVKKGQNHHDVILECPLTNFLCDLNQRFIHRASASIMGQCASCVR